MVQYRANGVDLRVSESTRGSWGRTRRQVERGVDSPDDVVGRCGFERTGRRGCAFVSDRYGSWSRSCYRRRQKGRHDERRAGILGLVRTMTVLR